MAHGRAVRKNFPGMVRDCRKCSTQITITEQMCKHSTYVCGPCQSAAATDWGKRNKDKKRALVRAWSSKNSANRSENTRLYRERHPDRRAAHQAVQTALRNGSLVRAACVICGGAKAHAHHDDYAKPLDVVWLCHSHHMERHSMLAARKAPRS